MANEPKKPTNGPGSHVAKSGDAPLPPATIPDLEETMKAQMANVTKNDFYKVGSRKNDRGQWEDVMAPSARILQRWANEGSPICTKIIETVETKDGCSVKVRGWIGDEAQPVIVHEEAVSMIWAFELEFLLTEAVSKGISVPKTDGTWGTQTIKPPFNVEYDETTGVSRIVLTDPAHQLHVLSLWVRSKRFGLRTCVTKAESRIFRKILSGEWREEAELEMERADIASIAEANGVVGHQAPEPPQTPPPIDTARLVPKKETNGTGTVSPMAITSLTTRFRDLGEEKFPLPPGIDHAGYLLRAALGAMLDRGAQISEARLDAMTPSDAGKLWELIGKVSHGDEAAMSTIDTLFARGVKVMAALEKSPKK